MPDQATSAVATWLSPILVALLAASVSACASWADARWVFYDVCLLSPLFAFSFSRLFRTSPPAKPTPASRPVLKLALSQPSIGARIPAVASPAKRVTIASGSPHAADGAHVHSASCSPSCSDSPTVATRGHRRQFSNSSVMSDGSTATSTGSFYDRSQLGVSESFADLQGLHDPHQMNYIRDGHRESGEEGRGWVTWCTAEEEQDAVDRIMGNISDIARNPQDGHLSEETAFRFLRANKGDEEVTEQMLRDTEEWRAECRPWEVDCPKCIGETPFHTFRQIGFDRKGRPVIYSCIKQEVNKPKVQPEDANLHCMMMLEEAVKTMNPGVAQWVWAMDMNGMGLRHCDPTLVRHMNPLFSKHYPERLGMAFIINAPRIFSTLWAFCRKFVDPNTVAKVRFAREPLREHLDEVMPPALAQWMEEEIRANQTRNLSPSQARWWAPPLEGVAHDARGPAEYTDVYVNPLGLHVDGHRPHPAMRELVWPRKYWSERSETPPPDHLVIVG